MAEWLYEAGIGENRAALVDGAIVEAHIETTDTALRVGAVLAVRLIEKQTGERRGLVRAIVGGQEALLDPLHSGIDMGRAVTVTVVREAIAEPGAVKRAKVRIADDAPLASGPTLLDRITATGITITTLTPHGADLLEAAGWSECLEEAALGEVRFAGGGLRISLTPAMTLIDVDGDLPPGDLAIAGARAAAAAIRRFGIAGSIGIDVPTVAGKAERLALAEAFDAAIPQPFERTAVNGFGFIQIVRPRLRASLCEQLRYDAASAHARALLRRAQRSGLVGAVELVAQPAVTDALAVHADWLDALSRHLGGTIALRADLRLAIGAGYASPAGR